MTDEERLHEDTGTGAAGDGAPPAADGTDDAPADAVHAVLGWATRDIPRFGNLLGWLCVTVYGPRIPAADAEAELASIGLEGPVFAPLRELLAGCRSGGDARRLAEGVRRAARTVRQALGRLPADRSERPRLARLHAALLVQANLLVPGTIDFDDLDECFTEPEVPSGAPAAWIGEISLEQYLAGLVDNLKISQRGDLAHLGRASARLRQLIGAVAGDAMAGTPGRRTLVANLGEALAQAAALSGSFQDADAALAVLRDLSAAHERDGAPPPIPLTLARVLREIDLVRRTADTTALPGLIDEVHRLYASLPPEHELRFAVAGVLGEAHLELATRSGDQDRRSAAARHLREVVDTAPERIPPLLAAAFPEVRAAMLAQLVILEPTRQSADRAVAVIRELTERADVPLQELRLRHRLGRALLYASDALDDPGLLDQSIAELSRAGDLVDQGHAWAFAAETLAALSDAYWMRGRRGTGPRGDLAAGLSTRHRVLARLMDDVLLQLGAEHGLAAARSGSAQALWLAFWYAAMDRPADALGALETGRSLVLRAAAAARGVPELLQERGRPDLARRWRAEAPEDLLLPGATAALLDPSGGPRLPGGLRRTVLSALRSGGDSAAALLAGAPDASLLAGALAEAGADALVYLVPGQRPGMSGFALLLRPGQAAPAVLKLPLLTLTSPPLKRYIDATAHRSRNLADPAAHDSWRAAWEAHWQVTLDELCDWAWPAAMGPVLAAVGPLTGAPRVVLVPCGTLGAVPWHAARTPYGYGPEGDGRTPPGPAHRYACQEAVLSYAASGGHFLRSATRPRMPVSGRRVLVTDPELTLLWADIETEALRTACYPDALRYGPPSTDGAAPDAPGTPDDLLAALPGGPAPAAVLHVACHALAAPSPARSALRLAVPPGGGPDAGRLTVARILDGAPAAFGGDPARDVAGGLVVLSACETDLSTRDHDEALTLATALVARGAADVVGSRWAVHGAPTALMMAVFHHFGAACGLGPADALRAAQLWMLDPYREPSPTLHPLLRGETARGDLHRVHNWAAFTHQGSPMPAVAK